MRLLKHLNEKWYGTVRLFNQIRGDYEIFTNPSRKEINDAKGDGIGLRYTIDFAKKTVYVTSADVMHTELFNVVKELPDYDAFWYREEQHTTLFTGDTERGNHNSDALGMYELESLDALLAQDWKWVQRYLDAKGIKQMVEKQAELVRKRQ